MTAPAEPLVRGKRVSIRHLAARDREPLTRAVRASRRLHGSWASPPDDDESFAAYLRRARRVDVECLVVVRNEDGAIVGVFTLSQIFHGPFRNAYLGYFGLVPWAGNGYMHDGLQLVLRHAFGSLGLHRVEANIQPGNLASIALVSGAGFRREGFSPRYLKVAGRWRDHERWAILAEDLRGRPARSAAAAPPDPERGAGPRAKNRPRYRLPPAARSRTADYCARREGFRVDGP
ncbi:MAG: GNAT family N-acetyltransferase [Actinomycetota bacterium]